MQRSLHVDAKHERGSGHADDGDVESGQDAKPEVNLEEQTSHAGTTNLKVCRHGAPRPLRGRIIGGLRR